MNKREWRYYRTDIEKRKDLNRGDVVVASYHWNFGTTERKRMRDYEGVLEFIDNKGIVINGKRISYKSLECISTLADFYEPDAVLTPEGWVANV